MDKTSRELIPQAILRLTELYNEHEAAISDAHANMLFWQIVGVENDILQAAGIAGPNLDRRRSQVDCINEQGVYTPRSGGRPPW